MAAERQSRARQAQNPHENYFILAFWGSIWPVKTGPDRVLSPNETPRSHESRIEIWK